MPNIISREDFPVNVGPEDFRHPIDLDKVLFVKQNVRGKDGIIFFEIGKSDDFSETLNTKIVDRWTFMHDSLRNGAFDKLVRRKYVL